jgi:HAD superfamily hydrolase (TIGR01490 family)
MNLALFDFDGTITKNDSLIKFIRFAVGDLKFVFGLFILSPVLLAYKIKLIPNFKAKQKMLSYFFKGLEEGKIKAIAEEYSLEHLDKIVRPSALEKIKWHQTLGHEVVVVSASIECWLKPWCDKHSINVLCTQLEMKNGVFTGNFASKNCYGKEKVNRIRIRYNLASYDMIYSYGDSHGDKEMLDLADKKYYKYF